MTILAPCLSIPAVVTIIGAVWAACEVSGCARDTLRKSSNVRMPVIVKDMLAYGLMLFVCLSAVVTALYALARLWL